MKITDVPAYKRINENFEKGEFKEGTVSKLQIHSYEKSRDVTRVEYYVDAIQYGRISFDEIPKKYSTEDFFIHVLSSKDVCNYVKAHIGEEFDREFFKDAIATNEYALKFKENCFEYMPLEYIDEEMISCAMLKAINSRYVERRGDSEDWFYSVAKRKPEVLTQDFWTLGARCFAAKRNGENKFLEITPKQYRTKEYYFAMCLENNTPVMEDFPKEIITTEFLIALINDSAENIKSFSEDALEQEVLMLGQSNKWKFWQVAIMKNGKVVRNIQLNDERVKFFLAYYDKDSNEYRYGFKDEYKRYLRSKQGAFCKKTKENGASQKKVENPTLLPIQYEGRVPKEFCKKYDEEEYLLEIYKKFGIEIIGEYNRAYYEVKLPQHINIKEKYEELYLMNGDECILKYYRTTVLKIYSSLLI